MKVLIKGITKNGVPIQIEEWSEDYSFMPYGSTLASYPKSKVSHSGQFAPKANETYRFEFTFNSFEETKKAFEELVKGNKTLFDYKNYLRENKYHDCI